MPKFYLIWALVMMTLTAGSHKALGQMVYFADDIDYWGHVAPAKAVASVTPIHSSAPKANESATSFDWHSYLDPKTDDFFREGDYLPPAPFMTVARDPSDENLRHWFAYIQKKNDVASRLETRMQEFVTGQLPAQRADTVSSPSPKPKTAAVVATVDPERFMLRFYFESTCPHCRRMAPEVEKLRKAGFAVAAKQVDAGPMPEFGGLEAAAEKATSEELKRYAIQAVPVLLIADLKTRAVYRLSGYQSAETILEHLKTKS